MTTTPSGTSSVLFIGASAESEAKRYVEILLGVSETDLHPDLYVVDATDGAGVDEAEEIIKKSTYLPVAAPFTLIFIKRMEKMTEAAQNKLLKTVEETSHVVFVMTADRGKGVLETIKSRVRVKTLTPPSFAELASEVSVPEYFVRYRSGNADDGLLAIYEKVYSAVANRNVKALFDTLHLTDEKDKENFFLIYKSEIKSLYSLILSAMTESGFVDESICQLIEENLRYCESVSYTKDNFFMCMASLGMFIRKEKI